MCIVSLVRLKLRIALHCRPSSTRSIPRLLLSKPLLSIFSMPKDPSPRFSRRCTLVSMSLMFRQLLVVPVLFCMVSASTRRCKTHPPKIFLVVGECVLPSQRHCSSVRHSCSSMSRPTIWIWRRVCGSRSTSRPTIEFCFWFLTRRISSTMCAPTSFTSLMARSSSTKETLMFTFKPKKRRNVIRPRNISGSRKRSRTSRTTLLVSVTVPRRWCARHRAVRRLSSVWRSVVSPRLWARRGCLPSSSRPVIRFPRPSSSSRM
mmetsp:Transcript_3854/g.9410  ORF Transcript_3854/g.9410 Transcript_3854/m.9410 type:complete len:261 (+) Transcript_3854:3663-4445(+)